jgi:hypothetical protein
MAQPTSSCTFEDGVDLVIRDVTVVDVARSELRAPQDVAVEHGVICTPDRDAARGALSAKTVVDGTGQYLVPGLMEMHGHVSTAEELTLYLANGVTTVRNLWGESWTLALRDRMAGEPREYPTLYTAGPIVDGAPPVNYPFVVLTDPREAEAEIARQAAAGYDFVKIYSNLSPRVFDAVIAAGKKYDIEISGHLPHDVALPHALDSGMRTMEHFLEVADELLRYPPSADLDLYVVYPETEALLEAIGRGEVALDDVVDRSRIAEVAAHAADSETWFDPTLMPMRNFTTRPNERNDAWHRYVAPATKAYWEGAWAAREGWSGDARRGEDQLYALRLELLGAMHAAGAHVLSGTDAPVPGMYHGFSLVDEIEQLTQAGLSKADALRAATLEGALYLGREGELGEVRAGAVADLVLLEANPLDDLQNLRRITGVVKAGKWHAKTALDARLEAIAEHYAAQEALFEGAPALNNDAEAREGEAVRTTAVKVGNKPVDFLAGDGTQAARLRVEEGEATRATLAVKAGDKWSTASVVTAPGSVEVTRLDGVTLKLQRSEGTWTLREEKQVIWQTPSDGVLLPMTGTPLDIPLFAALAVSAEKSSMPLHVWACDLAADCAEKPVAAFVEDRGFEKIHAVFSGTRHLRLTARRAGTLNLWIGDGPFYSGQPVRLRDSAGNSWERFR